MIENQKFKPAQVIGPLGEPLTLDSLPPPSTTRWVVRRKAEVVAAVNGGLLTIDDAKLTERLEADAQAVRELFSSAATPFARDLEALTTDLKSGRREYLYDALVDSTFEAMESVLAGFCALRLACAIRGIDVAGESGLESLGFSPADVADFTFGAFGFPDRVVAVESDCLHVVLGADSMMGVTIAVGATLGAVRGHPFKSVRVELSDGAVWLCQMDLYSAFRAAADDFEKQVALMRIQAGWRSLDGGTAWASSPVLRKWAATQVTETMSLDTHEKFKRLRLLRAFAEQVGERELATTIRGFVGWARLDLLGQQGGEPERKAVGQILDWATAAVEFDLI